MHINKPLAKGEVALYFPEQLCCSGRGCFAKPPGRVGDEKIFESELCSQEPVVLLGHSLGGSIVEAHGVHRQDLHEGLFATDVQVLLAKKKDTAAKVQGAILLCPVPVMSFCVPAAEQTRQTE